ncbi:hypothetical protein SMACR_03346 [Sordaria macrospora]|uniref:WGS project CABT00000000 data, contig 2.10 n=2 Tax=Sordaria macrospora TaxID=5147 RepID=F7VWM2_SORMK|nr:uncharacterized protein SMAC_03346 [Sordaria macrospora k-hell]KAA8629033.1 hypothetical protein SMACR_03346 [Sordaria macrospora]WPJ66695.1 hypothetical protein SMAC4_03346 [Sordaria macrospora]CCC09790.1 unnamed protein product [Sordaria macrospora k-hell]
MATRIVTVQPEIGPPAPARADDQHLKFTRFHEHGAPKKATPGQLLWPVVLTIQREDPTKRVDFEVDVTWIAVSDSGTAMPQVQPQEVEGVVVKKILDHDLPPTCRLGHGTTAQEYRFPPGTTLNDSPIVHVVIQNLKAPRNDVYPRQADAAPTFRLFIRLYDVVQDQQGRMVRNVFFNTCLRCSDSTFWGTLAVGAGTHTLLQYPGNAFPPPFRGPNDTVDDSQPPKLKMSPWHAWFLVHLKAAEKIGDYEKEL